MDQNRIADTVSAADYGRMTAHLVSAYVRRNNVPVSDLATLIASAADALIDLTNSDTPAAPATSKTTPAQIRASITHEALISFEDGKRYQTLKRHLTACGLTPETYRAKWGLPRDYPMVARILREAVGDRYELAVPPQPRSSSPEGRGSGGLAGTCAWCQRALNTGSSALRVAKWAGQRDVPHLRRSAFRRTPCPAVSCPSCPMA